MAVQFGLVRTRLVYSYRMPVQLNATELNQMRVNPIGINRTNFCLNFELTGIQILALFGIQTFGIWVFTVLLKLSKERSLSLIFKMIKLMRIRLTFCTRSIPFNF